MWFEMSSLRLAGDRLDHEARREILESLSLVHVSARSDERPAAYEDRAVQEVASKYQGYRELSGADPSVKGVSRAQPDGLFLNRQENRLMIVEAKKGRPDFAEGTSQVVQYYAQARANPQFAAVSIASVLISETSPTRGYEAWQSLMERPQRSADLRDRTGGLTTMTSWSDPSFIRAAGRAFAACGFG
jgi:hypothetical protein